MNEWTKVILAGLGLFAISNVMKGKSMDIQNLSFLGEDLPRGIRNNNPGNLKLTGIDWQGKIPAPQNTDGVFEQFQTYVYGVRAMIKLLRNYIRKKGLDTISQIIPTYAPASDNNDEEAYITSVENRSGIDRHEPINPDSRTQMKKLVQAMAYHENGQKAISDDMFALAWEMSIA